VVQVYLSQGSTEYDKVYVKGSISSPEHAQF